MTAPRTAHQDTATQDVSSKAPFAVLDERITRALIALRQARTASRVSRTPLAELAVERAEANLNSLLDYRSAVSRRSR